jgi:hypothetical protein
MPQVVISRERFRQLLRHGRGSAMQYVQQHGLSEVVDDVLAACLRNQAYDPQCEDGRAPWLFRMFRDTPEYPRFAAAICAALATEQESCHDLSQLIRLVSVMAQAGDQVAADALRARFSPQVIQPDDEAWSDADALVALDGVPAALALARHMGPLLAEYDWRLPSLDTLCDGLPILDEAESALRRLAVKDEDLRRYLAFTDAERQRFRLQQEVSQEQRQQARHARACQELTLQAILAAASRMEGEFPGRYMRFGRCATLEELHSVLQCLETELRDEVCLRLLWVFRRTPLPALTTKVWACARSAPGQLRDAALTALGQTRHADIGCFAREALRGGHLAEGDAALLELFVSNYAAGDAALIHAALPSACANDDTLHAMGSSLLHLCEENPGTEIAPLLMWICEQTPCTICRRSAVKIMVDHNCLSVSMAEECSEDADEDTREYGRAMLEVHGDNDRRECENQTTC